MFYTQPSLQKIKKLSFPAPPEVDRGLYYATVNESPELQKFPSPLEVDRFLYPKQRRKRLH
ncbi:hypothetical protein HMPREF2805_05395 [Streptococcus sp. HMSC034E03]|nr:hypothetical protein HMPREF2805_05395 [Streptococcus sp. HMSC034E03]